MVLGVVDTSQLHDCLDPLLSKLFVGVRTAVLWDGELVLHLKGEIIKVLNQNLEVKEKIYLVKDLLVLENLLNLGQLLLGLVHGILVSANSIIGLCNDGLGARKLWVAEPTGGTTLLEAGLGVAMGLHLLCYAHHCLTDGALVQGAGDELVDEVGEGCCCHEW